MRAKPQHKQNQSRVLQLKQSKDSCAFMVDNRNTIQTKLIDTIQRVGVEDEPL